MSLSSCDVLGMMLIKASHRDTFSSLHCLSDRQKESQIDSEGGRRREAEYNFLGWVIVIPQNTLLQNQQMELRVDCVAFDDCMQ